MKRNDNIENGKENENDMRDTLLQKETLSIYAEEGDPRESRIGRKRWRASGKMGDGKESVIR